jgi:hypothetical protein
LAEFIFETSESFEQTEIKITREPSLSSWLYFFCRAPLTSSWNKWSADSSHINQHCPNPSGKHWHYQSGQGSRHHHHWWRPRYQWHYPQWQRCQSVRGGGHRTVFES